MTRSSLSEFHNIRRSMQKRLALGHKQDDHLLDYDEQSL